jgi:hypothetical protein
MIIIINTLFIILFLGCLLFLVEKLHGLEVPTFNTPEETNGVFLLAMGRSGTSMLTGLLSYTGLHVGGPLIKPNSGNEKGYFERLDVMRFNEKLLQNQSIAWSGAVHQYDVAKAIAFMHDIGRFDSHFQSAFKFMNGSQNTPWIVKEPRLCITLPTWLPYLSKPPAVIFTYRHPFDVALSIHTRHHIAFGKALVLWYYYNYNAIQNSRNLCRVITSDKKIINNTVDEIQRILDGLRQCRLSIQPVTDMEAFNEKVYSFYDQSLRHAANVTFDPTCQRHLDSSRLIVEDLNSISEIWSHLNRTSTYQRISDIENIYYNATTEEIGLHIYKEVLKIYCMIEDHVIFSPNYIWNVEAKFHKFEPYLRVVD